MLKNVIAIMNNNKEREANMAQLVEQGSLFEMEG